MYQLGKGNIKILKIPQGTIKTAVPLLFQGM